MPDTDLTASKPRPGSVTCSHSQFVVRLSKGRHGMMPMPRICTGYSSHRRASISPCRQVVFFLEQRPFPIVTTLLHTPSAHVTDTNPTHAVFPVPSCQLPRCENSREHAGNPKSNASSKIPLVQCPKPPCLDQSHDHAAREPSREVSSAGCLPNAT